MNAKTISLSNEAYESLSREKLKGESFSKVVIRLVTKADFMSYAGAWENIPDEDIKAMKAGISEMRKSATDRLIK